MASNSTNLSGINSSPTETKSKPPKKTFSQIGSLVNTRHATTEEVSNLTTLRDKFLAACSEEASKLKASIKIEPKPFVVDVVNDVYSLDGPLNQDSAYNRLLSLFIDKEQVNLIEVKQSIESADAPVVEHMSKIIGTVKIGGPIHGYWTDTGNLSHISKLAVRTIASDVWTKELGFDPLIHPSQLNIERKEKEPKNVFKERQRQFFKLPISRHYGLLANALRGVVTTEKSVELSNALVHMLRTVLKSSPGNYLRWIRTIPKLVPTVNELQRLGKIPDIKIRNYKNIFTPEEWGKIVRSPLYESEVKTKQRLQKKLEADDVPSFLHEMKELGDSVETTPSSAVILAVKKKRLAHTSRWKKKAPRETIVPFDKVKRTCRDDAEVVMAFAPWRILAAFGVKGADTADSRLTYSSKDRSWGFESYEDDGTDEVNLAGASFAALLNS